MKIEIDNKICEFAMGETIMQVADKNNIKIPRLCFLRAVCEEANCRICILENMKNGRLITTCCTNCEDGMVLKTTQKVIDARKNTLRMLLYKHEKNCGVCVKNGICKLQSLCEEYGVEKDKYICNLKPEKIDLSSPCIVKNINKCILCGRCVNICKNTQAVGVYSKTNRGIKTKIACAFNSDLSASPCVGCGQCTLVCPTAALYERSEAGKVLKMLKDENSFVTAQVAPSVRVALAEAFGEPVGTFDEGRMVTALKMIGFDKVFDINLGADFTVHEEGMELLERIKDGKNLPLFSSCCPAWFKFVQNNYPENVGCLSSCKSPTEMLGAIVKNYYANTINQDKKNIKVVGIMPCTAKKGERLRGKDVDAVITTRELARIIKDKKINYLNLKPSAFDVPMSHYSGAGLIFGATGGVTEAVLRNVIGELDESQKDIVDFDVVRQGKGIKEVEIKTKSIKLNLCIVSGLSNAKKVFDDILAGKRHFHFVEVMACPGGCVNGGGQTLVDYDKIDVEDVKHIRANSLYQCDKTLKERKADDNLTLQEVYKNFFIPSPQKAKELLHYKRIKK